MKVQLNKMCVTVDDGDVEAAMEKVVKQAVLANLRTLADQVCQDEVAALRENIEAKIAVKAQKLLDTVDSKLRIMRTLDQGRVDHTIDVEFGKHVEQRVSIICSNFVHDRIRDHVFAKDTLVEIIKKETAAAVHNELAQKLYETGNPYNKALESVLQNIIAQATESP